VSDAYCIKSGYRAGDVQATFDSGDAAPYWNPSRVEASGSFQYYVYTTARDLLRARGYHSAMDVGCGPATKVRDLLAPHCADLQLVDQPSALALAAAAVPGAPFLAADLEGIDADLGRHFDLVICADVVEHLLEPGACVDFVRRHLAPGGRAVFSTPERDHLRGADCMASSQAEHVREWSAAEFAAYLHKSGFVVERQLFFPLQRIGRLEFAASRLFGRWFRKRDWAACQTVVCCLPNRAEDSA
jgi:SAM-dependent methyltransferase